MAAWLILLLWIRQFMNHALPGQADTHLLDWPEEASHCSDSYFFRTPVALGAPRGGSAFPPCGANPCVGLTWGGSLVRALGGFEECPFLVGQVPSFQ